MLTVKKCVAPFLCAKRNNLIPAILVVVLMVLTMLRIISQLQGFVNRIMKVRNFGGVVLLKENSVPPCVCE